MMLFGFLFLSHKKCGCKIEFLLKKMKELYVIELNAQCDPDQIKIKQSFCLDAVFMQFT